MIIDQFKDERIGVDLVFEEAGRARRRPIVVVGNLRLEVGRRRHVGYLSCDCTRHANRQRQIWKKKNEKQYD